jgi:hypothetical protein
MGCNNVHIDDVIDVIDPHVVQAQQRYLDFALAVV